MSCPVTTRGHGDLSTTDAVAGGALKIALRGDGDDLAGLEGRQQGQHLGHKGPGVDEPDARSLKHYHGNGEAGHVLLEGQVAITRDEDLEIRFSQREQVAVLDAVPTQLLNRLNCMTWQVASESPVQALVEQHCHFKRG